MDSSAMVITVSFAQAVPAGLAHQSWRKTFSSLTCAFLNRADDHVKKCHITAGDGASVDPASATDPKNGNVIELIFFCIFQKCGYVIHPCEGNNSI